MHLPYSDMPILSSSEIECIEYVDLPPARNPKDTAAQHFHVKANNITESTEMIKWCRRNFGTRGDGWDFSGNMQNVEITIWSSRLITMYRMWKE
jgi:hypothetical protein